MTRIIAGQWGGRRLRTPPGDGTRPTSDRVRESMFQSMGTMLGGFASLRVLDLFAGSGALGLEAESRGAVADLVESDRRAASVIAQNVRDLGSRSRLHRITAERFLAGRTGAGWDLALLDPPYAMATGEVHSLLRRLGEDDNLHEDALVVIERSTRDPFGWPEGFEELRHKAYGETTLWYGRPVVDPVPATRSGP